MNENTLMKGSFEFKEAADHQNSEHHRLFDYFSTSFMSYKLKRKLFERRSRFQHFVSEKN